MSLQVWFVQIDPPREQHGDLQLEGGSGIMEQDSGELLIYKIYSAARACHQSADLAIAQFGSGLEDRPNGLSTSKRPEHTMVPGPSSLTDCIKAWVVTLTPASTL